eukprot:CAMPEP_0201878026 /NCGR_PEP_ID=MMETSP0902-20130614/9293_1 /ASSEMBLY_ACC=CAM_ASM_000551 /TAXON_ID=420261 /ORGANISM="Thalassiosira antarctica, Strain CCMP982" /LENGTH=56 /DNA_ID=CAMNT_0048405597 /DNA_START=35 /DNA_END=205 /DNA_ORIENTATION=-
MGTFSSMITWAYSMTLQRACGNGRTNERAFGSVAKALLKLGDAVVGWIIVSIMDDG